MKRTFTLEDGHEVTFNGYRAEGFDFLGWANGWKEKDKATLARKVGSERGLDLCIFLSENYVFYPIAKVYYAFDAS
jgi:hypothetical protein